jgi:predicted dehydrogenase
MLNTPDRTQHAPARGGGTLTPARAETLRVGVVGAGYWGPKLIRNFAALSEADLAMVCDASPPRLAAMGEEFPGPQLTTDFATVLASDVDAVAIATPLATHYHLVKQALLAGKHVLVEKPLTDSVQRAAELVALAEQRGLTLMVGHTFLFEPAVEALRDVVRSGSLGTIWHVNSERLNLGLFRRDANVLWDLAPHDVAILLEILGLEPEAVSARGACQVQPGIQDVAYLELRFPRGIMAHVHVSWLDPGKVRRLTVIGSEKMAVYDDTAADKLWIYDRAVLPTDGTLVYHFGEATSVPLPTSAEPLRRQCAHFLECIRTGRRPRPDGRHGLTVVRILEQATDSLQDGGYAKELRWDAIAEAPLPLPSPMRPLAARPPVAS